MGGTRDGPMTPRRRFAETMRYGRPDRVPYFEEGFRDDVLERWREQGLGEADLSSLFEYDRREEVPVDLGPRPGVDRWPATRRDLADWRQRFDPADPGRLPEDWPQRVAAWRARDHLLQMQMHRGFFLTMGVDDWSRFLEVLYLVKDAPSVVAEMMEIVGECSARLAERVLAEVDVDFVTFSEPIGGNDGPLLGPEAYGEFVLRTYRPILETVRRAGVETAVFVTYANARPLLRGVVEAGFDCLWACETEGRAMDYQALRREFGQGLRLIGGIDLDALLAGSEAIRREIETKVPPLLAQGGFIPLADGRVRANVPFDAYVAYRRALERVTRV